MNEIYLVLLHLIHIPTDIKTINTKFYSKTKKKMYFVCKY